MKITTKVFALILIFSLVGCGVVDTVSSITSSEYTSSEDTSSKQTTSKEEAKLTDFLLEDGFLDVQAASKVFKPKGNNDSHLFVETEGIKGYEINGGIYWVDADTMRRLVNVPCRGDGKLKWRGFLDCGSWSTANEQPEFAPANLINDPIYMSMVLPSERACFMESRVNPSFLDVASDKWINVMTIGAVYKNSAVEIPDDAEITLCISDINLAVRTTKSNGWYEAINLKVPTVYNHLYYLPWTLEKQLGSYEIFDRVTEYDDHVEIKLYGYDFNATEAKKVSNEVQQCVYHFWGKKHYFDCKGSEVLGVACSFKIWVKEPEAAEYLVVGIGADWRDEAEKPLQVFAGYKHAVTNEPTVVIGHNVEPSHYEEVMDSQKVQEILGIR